LNISVQEAEKLSLEEIRRLLEASEGIRFAGEKRAQVYGWIEQVLCQQEYGSQGKASRGLLRRYIEKMTGMSRAQVTRLIGRYIGSGRVGARVYRRHRFAQRYTTADIELLASVDEAHETLSGPQRVVFWSASISSTASRNMRGWLRSPSPTYTTCAGTGAIGNAA
jgi:predicted DNA-binding transcriptional regulator AlpA